MNKSSGALHVRREVRSLGSNDPTLRHYADAVGAMERGREHEQTDPTSWLFQAAIHGTIVKAESELARKHWNQCTHGSWFFVSWHRIYVYYFEEIVRSQIEKLHGSEAAEAWALPYWNYCRGEEYASLPETFRKETWDDGTRNWLYVEERGEGINEGAELPAFAIRSDLALERPHFLGTEEFGGEEETVAQFAEKGGIFEGTPHGSVHDNVGGWMSRIKTAAKDPIFWLHHCNIDRIWAEWIAQGEGRENPDESAWLNQPFEFFKPDGTTGSKTCGQVVKTEALGYKYDAVNGIPSGPEPNPLLRPGSSSESEVAVSATQNPPPDPKIVGASDEVTLTGEPAAIPVEIDQRAREEVREASTESDPRRLYLNIEDIEAEAHPGTSYGIYVNLPEGADEDTKLEHHVGNITFFGMDFGDEPLRDEPVHNRQVKVEVGPLLRKLGGGERFDEKGIEVTLLPLLPKLPKGSADAPRRAMQERAKEATVSVGRVSLAVDA